MVVAVLVVAVVVAVAAAEEVLHSRRCSSQFRPRSRTRKTHTAESCFWRWADASLLEPECHSKSRCAPKGSPWQLFARAWQVHVVPQPGVEHGAEHGATEKSTESLGICVLNVAAQVLGFDASYDHMATSPVSGLGVVRWGLHGTA